MPPHHPEHPEPRLDPAIAAYYARSPEEDRHTRGLNQLEAYRTRQLIERHAPPAPATVLDVGGAAGAYAFWLAERGYTVHLLDPVPRLIDEARSRAASLGRPLASCQVGDARALPYPDRCAQVVLLLGPLYHLIDPADRARALAEAARVLAPGGILFAAAITRWAYALYGLMRDLLPDPAFQEIVDASVRDGAHRPRREGFFTDAYFHRPEELDAELRSAGFVVEGCYGLEGPCGMLPDFDARWSDPVRRAGMIHVAEMVESEPSLLGMSPHILAVARRA
ncbi:MAG TPA: class I SAM-dependent methyltransferase [Longimicrobium sp.]|jgi:SAM-dependent methyltransferase|uniref:class I SAM-dependent methyltransferase n=1 Tax=Longimicrobium sp. TaxID=2029185 RepID=UPI002ED7DD47